MVFVSLMVFGLSVIEGGGKFGFVREGISQKISSRRGPGSPIYGNKSVSDQKYFKAIDSKRRNHFGFLQAQPKLPVQRKDEHLVPLSLGHLASKSDSNDDPKHFEGVSTDHRLHSNGSQTIRGHSKLTQWSSYQQCASEYYYPAERAQCCVMFPDEADAWCDHFNSGACSQDEFRHGSGCWGYCDAFQGNGAPDFCSAVLADKNYVLQSCLRSLGYRYGMESSEVGYCCAKVELPEDWSDSYYGRYCDDAVEYCSSTDTDWCSGYCNELERSHLQSPDFCNINNRTTLCYESGGSTGLCCARYPNSPAENDICGGNKTICAGGNVDSFCVDYCEAVGYPLAIPSWCGEVLFQRCLNQSSLNSSGSCCSDFSYNSDSAQTVCAPNVTLCESQNGDVSWCVAYCSGYSDPSWCSHYEFARCVSGYENDPEGLGWCCGSYRWRSNSALYQSTCGNTSQQCSENGRESQWCHGYCQGSGISDKWCQEMLFDDCMASSYYYFESDQGSCCGRYSDNLEDDSTARTWQGICSQRSNACRTEPSSDLDWCVGYCGESHESWCSEVYFERCLEHSSNDEQSGKCCGDYSDVQTVNYQSRCGIWINERCVNGVNVTSDSFCIGYCRAVNSLPQWCNDVASTELTKCIQGTNSTDDYARCCGAYAKFAINGFESTCPVSQCGTNPTSSFCTSYCTEVILYSDTAVPWTSWCPGYDMCRTFYESFYYSEFAGSLPPESLCCGAYDHPDCRDFNAMCTSPGLDLETSYDCHSYCVGAAVIGRNNSISFCAETPAFASCVEAVIQENSGYLGDIGDVAYAGCCSQYPNGNYWGTNCRLIQAMCTEDPDSDCYELCGVSDLGNWADGWCSGSHRPRTQAPTMTRQASRLPRPTPSNTPPVSRTPFPTASFRPHATIYDLGQGGTIVLESTPEPIVISGSGTITPASGSSIILKDVEIVGGSSVIIRGLNVSGTLTMTGSAILTAEPGSQILILGSLEFRAYGKELPEITLSTNGVSETKPQSVTIDISAESFEDSGDLLMFRKTVIAGISPSICEELAQEVRLSDDLNFMAYCFETQKGRKLSAGTALWVKGIVPPLASTPRGATEPLDESKPKNVGMIVGIVVAVVAVIAIGAVVAVIFLRKGAGTDAEAGKSVDP